MRTRTESKASCVFKTDQPYKYYDNSLPVRNAPKAIFKAELHVKKNGAFNKMRES